MILMKEQLLEVIPSATIEASTYTIKNKTYIRLFNSNESKAHIPAIYPNIKEYKDKLKKYTNVSPRRVDQINGVKVSNRKIDMEIIVKDPELPPLPREIQDEQ